MLGRVVEVVTGKSLFQAEKERLLDPLDPADTSFYVTDAAKHRRAIATTPLYLPGPGNGFGLGFAVRKVTGEAAYSSEPGSYFWGGAGGSYFWVDPKTDLFVVLMLQSPKQRVHYRTLMYDMVYAAAMK